MKLKMKALSLAVAAIAAGSAAHAADIAMFPYVVNSATVTTLVSIVDQAAAGNAYDASGVADAGSRLHWRLNYKAGANASSNTATCEEVNYYLPSSPNDIQTVDLGGQFGVATRGVLFNDASVNNNWSAGTTDSINYMLGRAAGATQRGVLFVHNSDDTVAGTNDNSVYGEAMIVDFSTGAAWGYQALLRDNNDDGAAANAAVDFDFSGAATASPSNVLTFMPLAETTTRIFVTPVNAVGGSMLDIDGSSLAGVWNEFNTLVSLSTSTGVAFDRDENLISGTAPANVVCVGAVDASTLMTAGAATVLANGGWGTLRTAVGTTTGATPTANAVLTKLEFNTTGTLNGQAIPGTFNNGFIMR